MSTIQGNFLENTPLVLDAGLDKDVSINRAQDMVCEVNFDRLYLRHFFTKYYVKALVRIVSSGLT